MKYNNGRSSVLYCTTNSLKSGSLCNGGVKKKDKNARKARAA